MSLILEFGCDKFELFEKSLCSDGVLINPKNLDTFRGKNEINEKYVNMFGLQHSAFRKVR